MKFMTISKKPDKPSRDDRLAAQLRANLRRRKAAARNLKNNKNESQKDH